MNRSIRLFAFTFFALAPFNQTAFLRADPEQSTATKSAVCRNWTGDHEISYTGLRNLFDQAKQYYQPFPALLKLEQMIATLPVIGIYLAKIISSIPKGVEIVESSEEPFPQDSVKSELAPAVRLFLQEGLENSMAITFDLGEPMIPEIPAIIAGEPMIPEISAIITRVPKIPKIPAIIIGDELIEKHDLKDDEILAVLRHELGHHKYKHSLLTSKDNLGMIIACDAALLLSILPVFLSDTYYASTLAPLLALCLIKTGIYFAQKREYEADLHALWLAQDQQSLEASLRTHIKSENNGSCYDENRSFEEMLEALKKSNESITAVCNRYLAEIGTLATLGLSSDNMIFALFKAVFQAVCLCKGFQFNIHPSNYERALVFYKELQARMLPQVDIATAQPALHPKDD